MNTSLQVIILLIFLRLKFLFSVMQYGNTSLTDISEDLVSVSPSLVVASELNLSLILR